MQVHDVAHARRHVAVPTNHAREQAGHALES